MAKENKYSLKNLLFIFFLFISLSSQAQTYWQQKVDHSINVRLDASKHAIDGFSKIHYTNNSPDTLYYIWFHIWPNAYQNDRTAFSEQLLENGDTKFYFSSPNKRGFINNLHFKTGELDLKTEAHPEYQDIIKLILPSPLLPKQSIQITTPFHVQLPFNFSRGGWNATTFQVTQWYPKPAVYDAKGWHPMPYLDQGEFYADFGDYEVTITVPQPFTIAATGNPQQPVENAFYAPDTKGNNFDRTQWNTLQTKTLTFKQKNIHDFAWFADPTLTLHKDTIQLPSGKIIQANVYFHLNKIDLWQNSLENVKQAIHTLSSWLGDYPYDVVTVIDGEMGFMGGMEYPTITMITGAKNQKDLDLVIFHEIGHNWFYGALASNERQEPWMDEGMNSYYEKRYKQLKYPYTPVKGILGLIYDPRFEDALLQQQIQTHKDQPISTPAEQFTASNYSFIAYQKTAQWMKKLERSVGTESFDNAMKNYFTEWKFKHPNRNNFKESIERSIGRNLDDLFTLLDKTGAIEKGKPKPLALLSHFEVHKIFDKQPIFYNPVAAINGFNGVMAGLVIHNLSLPMPRFTMILAPLYGFKSRQFNGWSRLGYTWYPKDFLHSIELSSINSNLHSMYFTDSTGRNYGRSFVKIAPSLKFIFKENDPRSSLKKSLQFRYIHIDESEYDFDASINDLIKVNTNYVVLQSRFLVDDTRSLYPWKAEVSAESHKDFYRLAFQGKYFFNFIKKGGVQVRFFAGKFMYKGSPNLIQKFKLERNYLQMTGPKGYEDYTYSTAYLSRYAFNGFASQQIIERDGYFKVRTDLLSDKIGRSDNWLSSLNMEMDIPDGFNPLQKLPIKIPLKLFFDVGTNGNVWKVNATDPRFLFDGGIQISLLKNTINFYFPIIYSKVYRDYFKSVPGNQFFQRMSFSINLADFNPFKLKRS